MYLRHYNFFAVFVAYFFPKYGRGGPLPLAAYTWWGQVDKEHTYPLVAYTCEQTSKEHGYMLVALTYSGQMSKKFAYILVAYTCGEQMSEGHAYTSVVYFSSWEISEGYKLKDTHTCRIDLWWTNV